MISYTTDKIALYHARREEITKLLPDNCCDLVLEDPPFGVRSDEEWDNKQNFINSVGNWLSEAFRIAKHTVIWFTAGKSVPYIMKMIDPELFFRFYIWEKPAGTQFAGSSHNNLWYNFEPILVFSKDVKATIQYGKSLEYDYPIFRFRTVPYNVFLHPTSKPVGLLKRIIFRHTNPNDLVFDGFGGSFSTAVACLETNRKIISCEMYPLSAYPINEDVKEGIFNPNYFERGVNRIKNITETPTLFPVTQYTKDRTDSQLRIFE